ncbi:substrate-binding domain-containing protein [Paracoccus sp. M683]|uniref:substrate-binding domain-containing protein n=1 Tax=Paracoccus sp. M683 TaxID=2594268 RepID=UPI001C8F5748|nr:substrate-binding domain-containing protein [Paracoccus sp. M683]
MTFRKLMRNTALAGIIIAGCPAGTMAEGARIAIVGGKADDPFFAKVKRGVDDAGQLVTARGGSVNYPALQSCDNLGPDAAELIRTAVSQNVDGIAAPNWVPEAQDQALQAARDAGIPVLLCNAGGTEKAQELGAINYVGTKDYSAGLAAGEYASRNGAKNVLCVNTFPEAANLEARCKGIIDAATENGAAARQLPLPASSFGDPTAVSEAIKATLLQDDSIDAVITQGSQHANSGASAIAQSGAAERVMLGTFNLDGASLYRIKDGTQAFAVDQLGYMQGYLAVFLLDSYVNYAMDPPSKPILTGPVIVDAANIDATIAGVDAGAC